MYYHLRKKKVKKKSKFAQSHDSTKGRCAKWGAKLIVNKKRLHS